MHVSLRRIVPLRTKRTAEVVPAIPQSPCAHGAKLSSTAYSNRGRFALDRSPGPVMPGSFAQVLQAINANIQINERVDIDRRSNCGFCSGHTPCAATDSTHAAQRPLAMPPYAYFQPFHVGGAELWNTRNVAGRRAHDCALSSLANCATGWSAIRLGSVSGARL